MEPGRSYGSSGAILLMHDEPKVRREINTILCRAGYPVFLASSGEGAIRLFEKHSDQITLLLTNVEATGMSGPALAGHLEAIHPHLKVLYMSGLNNSVVVRRYVSDPGLPLLRKPIGSGQLLTAVGNAIGPAHRAAHGV